MLGASWWNASRGTRVGILTCYVSACRIAGERGQMTKSSLRLPHALLLFLAVGCALPLAAQETGPMPASRLRLPLRLLRARLRRRNLRTSGWCELLRERAAAPAPTSGSGTTAGGPRLAAGGATAASGPRWSVRAGRSGSSALRRENHGAVGDAYSAGAAQCHIHAQRAAGRSGVFRDFVSGDD